MKIIKFQGGLGNQLFQYTCLRYMQIIHHFNDVRGDFSLYNVVESTRDLYIEKNGMKVPNIKKLNIKNIEATNEEFNEVFILKRRSKILSKFDYRIRNFVERTFNNKYYSIFGLKDKEITSILEYSYFEGYWGSWRYVNEIEQELRNELTFKNKYSDQTQQVIDQLSKENAVFMGVRRGDYLKNEATRNLYGSFSTHYYNKAIRYIKEHVENPIFYVFSDDIPWVKENMNFEAPVNYREKEDQTNDVEELFIMGACKHSIIVNSTFQWWGAWLIKNKDKIIFAPDSYSWVNGVPADIVPPEWHQMKRC